MIDPSVNLIHATLLNSSRTQPLKFGGIVELSSTEVKCSQLLKDRLDAIYAGTVIPGTIFNPNQEIGSHQALDAFRLKVVLNLTELAEMVKTEIFEECEVRAKALICTVPFLKLNRWSSSAVVDLANQVFDTLFNRADRNFLDQHLVRCLLNNHIRPKFASQAPRPPISFIEPSAIEKAKDHSHLHWKTEDGRIYLVYHWLLAQEVDLMPHLELVVQPALVVVYDYETRFREAGIELLTLIFKRTKRRKFESCGLVEVFGEAAANCLLFVPSDRSSQLADAALDLLIRLLAAVGSPGDKRYYQFLRRQIIQPALKRGMLSSKEDLASRRWWLTRQAELMRLSGPYLVAYLQKFVDAACLGLELPEFSHLRLNSDLPLLSCQVLRVLFELGRPRIAAYTSQIMVAIARCWVYISQDPRRNPTVDALALELKRLLADTYDISDKSVLEESLLALRDTDPTTFGPLLDHLASPSTSPSSRTSYRFWSGSEGGLQIG